MKKIKQALLAILVVLSALWLLSDVSVLQTSGFFGVRSVAVQYSGFIAIAVMTILAWRRAPGDLAVAAMLGAAGLYTASFFVISVACDYRYLYFLDVAAMAGTLYLAASAPWSGIVRAARAWRSSAV